MMMTSKITLSTTAIVTRYSTRNSDFLILLDPNSTRSKKKNTTCRGLIITQYHAMLFDWRSITAIFSCPEQLNRWLCHSLTHSLTEWLLILTVQSDPRDLWLLRNLIRVMRRRDLTKKSTYPPTTNLRKHPQGGILDTCDNWDIRSAVMIWHLVCSLMEQS